ncbi:hypothetical protein BLNAU_12153 [Blattamonas nauphoetae]|uniref:Uncharacterized protein n=1 Tax=Blattamonas nauphoetae TaxID=2049346 RepID=A0ABQ9XN64_9EUKA|nr:hypothetical protein BLNAU_12153 [Blattamonas nauphoetae]
MGTLVPGTDQQTAIQNRRIQTTPDDLFVNTRFSLPGPSSEMEQLVAQLVPAVRERVLFLEAKRKSSDTATLVLMSILENGQVG